MKVLGAECCCDLATFIGASYSSSPTHLVDIAVFCDSDKMRTASISYLAYVRLEPR
jgi:hypothetical protein